MEHKEGLKTGKYFSKKHGHNVFNASKGIYPLYVTLIWNVSEDQERAYLQRLGLNDAEIPKRANAVFWNVNNEDFVIALREWKNSIEGISQLAHECLHATLALNELLGVEIESNNDEPLAYYMQHLMKEFLEALTKEK